MFNQFVPVQLVVFFVFFFPSYFGTKELVVLLRVLFFLSAHSLKNPCKMSNPTMGDMLVGVGGLEINPRDSEREPVRTGSSAGANPEPSVLFVRLDGTK